MHTLHHLIEMPHQQTRTPRKRKACARCFCVVLLYRRNLALHVHTQCAPQQCRWSWSVVGQLPCCSFSRALDSGQHFSVWFWDYPAQQAGVLLLVSNILPECSLTHHYAPATQWLSPSRPTPHPTLPPTAPLASALSQHRLRQHYALATTC
jgi:hypothetical protein